MINLVDSEINFHLWDICCDCDIASNFSVFIYYILDVHDGIDSSVEEGDIFSLSIQIPDVYPKVSLFWKCVVPFIELWFAEA